MGLFASTILKNRAARGEKKKAAWRQSLRSSGDSDDVLGSLAPGMGIKLPEEESFMKKAWKPIDFLLSAPEYAIGGAANELWNQGETGEGIDLMKALSAAGQNVVTGKKTYTDYLKEQEAPDALAYPLGFAASVLTPAIPLAKVAQGVKGVSKLVGATDAAKAGITAAKGIKIGEQTLGEAAAPIGKGIKRVMNAFKYRGGQPTEYVEAAEAMEKAIRDGDEEAIRIGKLLTENLTHAEQLRIGQIMRGGVSSIADDVVIKGAKRTNGELKAIAAEARAGIDTLSKRLLGQAMQGAETQIAGKSMGAELVNFLGREYKAPGKGLGEVGSNVKSTDELASTVMDVLRQKAPAIGTDGIGMGTKGTLRGLEGGEDVVAKNFYVPRDPAVVQAEIARVKAELAATKGVADKSLGTAQYGREPADKLAGLLPEGTMNHTPLKLDEALGFTLPTNKQTAAGVRYTKSLKKLSELEQEMVDIEKAARSAGQFRPVGAKLPVPGGASAYTEDVVGRTPLTGDTGIKLGRKEMGLPEVKQPRKMLPVEKYHQEATSGGVAISEETAKEIEEGIGKYMGNFYRLFEKDPEKGVRVLMSGKGKSDLARLMRRKDLSDAAKQGLGIIQEPAYPTAKGMSQVNSLIQRSRFYRYVTDNFAQASNTTGDLVQLGTDKKFGPLAGKWVQREIADDINPLALAKAPGDFEKTYRKLLGAWKSGKILWNPGTRFRNQGSNIMLMDLVGEMPVAAPSSIKAWIEGGRDYVDQGELYQLTKKHTDLFSGTFFGNEIKPLLDSFEVQPGKNVLGRTWNAIKQTNAKLGSTYNAQEEFSKMALVKFHYDRVLGKLGKAATEADKIQAVKFAAKKADEALFNYNKIPAIIKKLRDLPFGYPFITFSYKAIPAVTKAFVKHPSRFKKYSALGKSVETAAEEKFGPEPLDALPDYIKEGSYLRLPVKQADGQELYLDLNYIVPWGDMTDNPSQTLLPSNPAFTLVADLSRNKSGFTGREIWNETDTDAAKVKKQGEYVYRALMPSLAPGVGFKGGSSFDKVVSAMRQSPDYFGRLRDVPITLADVLLGLKAQPMDIPRERGFRDYEDKNTVRDIKSKIKSTLKDHRLSPKEKQKKVQEYTKMLGNN